ncbi:MAG: deoxyribodipyrimidine photo-lyase [Candidatus Obscuribacter sp.]|jgi:deoxyribodipyrimidine photo-lyase|nr:deoxyribodipyrimidine photo-lyase [Candidatus Obscuribacter sp.]MBK9200903.1 deoxyribodipyrimidine photo-lyase [Candidatus Obscuribacter sp.]MBK9621585.1 deoxyribodipyrimidine photo-lyase [Candidatus Obscuribacter sp.]
MTGKAKSPQDASQGSSIVWFRQDLRLADNPALSRALDEGDSVYCVYIHAPIEEGRWAPGGATKVWLNQSLKALQQDLEDKGGRLHIFDVGADSEFATSQAVLAAIVKQTQARAIFWNRRYEPAIIERDKEIKSHFKEQGINVETFNSALLKEPWQVKTKEGKPYQVFTPFWRACLNEMHPDPPLSAPKKLPDNKLHKLQGEVALKKLALLPQIQWDKGIKDAWVPGEQGALKQLKTFLKDGLANYASDRNRPDIEGVSRLSPHLHFGEISPLTVWYQTKEYVQAHPKLVEAGQCYLREIGWREFSHHLLYHFPDTTTEPLRKEFSHFPWQRNDTHLKAWQKGLTGYPIVDAGMRELWHTGIMHNRVRMIVASFLVKHLLLPWQEGAAWFWDTLVDADLAQNTLGWQWTAGCGADAAPYFRVFNPILQGAKFDPDGDYVRRWVPELAGLDKKYIHTPWEAPPLTLTASGITLGEDYPRPIVDHGQARALALDAFQQLKAYK